MTHRHDDPVMLDMETLGTSPNSVILSIGAIKFDPDTNELHNPLYIVINTQSCLDVGMTINQDTLLWWEQQDPEASKVIGMAKESDVTIHEALRTFNKYVTHSSCVWGNGADFDNAMLQEAYNKCGIEPAWMFYNNRCYRTMKNMVRVEHKRRGVHHNALHDAQYQAEHLMKILQKFRSK